MQHTTYLRQHAYTVGLFCFVFFNGGSCCRTTQAVWPGINTSSDSSQKASIELKNECPICLEDLGDLTCGEKITSCKFNHEFHCECIKKWVNTQGPNLCIWVRKLFFTFHKLRCPMCNTEFDPNHFDLVSRHTNGGRMLHSLLGSGI